MKEIEERLTILDAHVTIKVNEFAEDIKLIKEDTNTPKADYHSLENIKGKLRDQSSSIDALKKEHRNLVNKSDLQLNIKKLTDNVANAKWATKSELS